MSKNQNGKFRIMDGVEHLQEKPEFYSAGIDKRLRKEYVYTDGNIRKVNIDTPEAVFRSFIEILSNAHDANVREFNNSGKLGHIYVKITKHCVTITNYGSSIDISEDEDGRYIPEMMFSIPMSSTNYQDDREFIMGTFGIGAKVTNTLSEWLRLRAVNKSQKKYYEQKWKYRMTKSSEPIVTRNKGDSFVEVSYKIDFNLLGSKRYSDDDIGVMVRYCFDLAYNSRQKIMVDIPSDSMIFDNITDEEFATAYFGKLNKHLVIQQSTLKLIVADPEEKIKGNLLSYCNSAETTDHGVHVNSTYKQLCTKLKDAYNAGLPETVRKINIVPIKNSLCCIVTTKVKNPKLDTASKKKLIDPTQPFDISDKDVEKMLKWSFMDSIREISKAQRKKILNTTNGKRVKNLPKGLPIEIKDAALAGGPRSRETRLMLVEGGSAEGHAEAHIETLPGGRLKYGSMCLNGVPPNMFVKGEDYEYLVKNSFYVNIKAVMGLVEGVDYTIPENRKKLRYGGIDIMVDADDDGSHIKGLLYEFLEKCFPSLIKIKGFIRCYETPVVRVYKGKSIISFYTIEQFRDWKEKNSIKGCKVKYFKGLATSTKADIKESSKNPRYVTYKIGEEDVNVMEYMFNPKKSDIRKSLLLNHNPDDISEPAIKEPLSYFFLRQYMRFMLTSLDRAIPKLISGLKEVQEKIAWSADTFFGENNNEAKMSKFIGNVITATGYLRGDASISEACIQMGKDHCGANNVEIIDPLGQFGSRANSGGSTPGSRYLCCKRGTLYRFLIRKEDRDVIPRKVDDDDKLIETEFIAPVLPFQLLNGSDGVACGWNCKIPLHEPLSVALSVLARLDGVEPVTPKPWSRKCMANEYYEVGDDGVYTLRGEPVIYYEEESKTLVIADMPSKIRPNKVLKKIAELLSEGRIEDSDNGTNMDNIWIVVYGIDSETLMELPMFFNRKMTSTTLLDMNKRPVNYLNIDRMLDDFCKCRLRVYRDRKKFIIKKLEDALKVISDKVKFIQLCRKKVILVDNQQESFIFSQMDKHDIPHDIFKKIKYREFSKENLDMLKEEIKKLEETLISVKKKHYRTVWREEIIEFMRAYIASYKEELLSFRDDRLNRLKDSEECSDEFVLSCYEIEKRKIKRFIKDEYKRLDKMLAIALRD